MGRIKADRMGAGLWEVLFFALELSELAAGGLVVPVEAPRGLGVSVEFGHWVAPSLSCISPIRIVYFSLPHRVFLLSEVLSLPDLGILPSPPVTSTSNPVPKPRPHSPKQKRPTNKVRR